MRVAKFTLEESNNHTLQMQVRCLAVPPTKQVNVVKSPTQTIDSTLKSTPVDTNLPIGMMSCIKKTRLTSAQAQQKLYKQYSCQVMIQIGPYKATIMYHEEICKPAEEKKLSAQQVSEKVQKEYRV